MAPKESYIRKFKPWNWIVGTGLYVEDLQDEIDAMESRVVQISLAITAVSALLLLYVAMQSMRIERRKRQVEDELHESHEKYRTLVEAATDGVLMFIEGQCTFANKTMSSMLDYGESEFGLLELDDFFVDAQAVSNIAGMLSEEAAIPPVFETQLKKKGGEVVEAAVTTTPVSLAGRTGMILAARNLSTRNPLEDARRRREQERENLIGELQTSVMFLHEPVSLCVSDAVSCDMNEAIGRAAERMRLSGVSAMLVTYQGEATGIVTHRDLCERAVAAGLPTSEPVRQIMSSPIVYIQEHSAVYEAILIMRERHLQHLVARDDSGQVTGIVDVRELLHFHHYSLAALAYSVRNAQSPEEILRIRDDLPRLVRSLIQGGARTRNITRSITTLSDTITCKLIHFAILEMGPPPATFAFLALGSSGREEQTLASDQDSALVFEDVDEEASPGVHDYFVRLGERVCSWLEQTGYPPCDGHNMASNPKWCQPLKAWQRYFTKWIQTAEPQNILNVMTFFDFRVVHGDKHLGALIRRHVDTELEGHPAFFPHYAQYALQYKVPIGFFGNIVADTSKDHHPKLDVKESMMPVVNFARLYALRYGVIETNTVDRLRALTDRGSLREGLCEEAGQVYDCLMQIRLTRQAETAAEGTPPTNIINPKELTHMQETLLKEAFTQVSTIQKKISFDFLGGRS